MIQIIDICRGYKSLGDRKRAMAQLRRRGYDHFVQYKDTAAEFALLYGKSVVQEKKQTTAGG